MSPFFILNLLIHNQYLIFHEIKVNFLLNIDAIYLTDSHQFHLTQINWNFLKVLDKYLRKYFLRY